MFKKEKSAFVSFLPLMTCMVFFIPHFADVLCAENSSLDFKNMQQTVREKIKRYKEQINIALKTAESDQSIDNIIHISKLNECKNRLSSASISLDSSKSLTEIEHIKLLLHDCDSIIRYESTEWQKRDEFIKKSETDSGKLMQMKTVLLSHEKKLRADPFWDFYEWANLAERDIIVNSHNNPVLISKYIDFYAQIILSDTFNVSLKKWATFSLIRLCMIFTNEKELVLSIVHPILINDLKDKSIDLRVDAAEALYNLGKKDEAYQVYIDMLSKPDINKWLDKEYNFKYEQEKKNLLSSIEYEKRKIASNNEEKHYLMHEDSITIVRRKEMIHDIQERISYIEIAKIEIINRCIEKLITYNNERTRSFVKRIVNENSYIATILNNPSALIDTMKQKIIASEWMKKNNLAKDVEKYINSGN